MVELFEPVDPVHADSLEQVAEIRSDFAKLRAAVAVWEPAPYPETPYVDRTRTLYLDEVDRPRSWFRA